MVAGAYPRSRPPNAWSPGLPAPPGPCYWLVASGILSGLRGGCLAVELVRGTVCHYCLGRCSALVLCARRSRQVRGVGAGAGFCVPPFVPPVPPGSSRCVWWVVPSGFPVFYRLPVRHSMPSVRVVGSVLSLFRFARRALCMCVHSGSHGVRVLPPSPGQCSARTACGSRLGHRWGRSRRFLPRSRAPSS